MAYRNVGNRVIGHQPIAENSTTKQHALGTIVQAEDPDLGSGEFIYLQGVASTVVGSAVLYNRSDNTTSLLAANDIGPVALAMSIFRQIRSSLTPASSSGLPINCSSGETKSSLFSLEDSFIFCSEKKTYSCSVGFTRWD